MANRLMADLWSSTKPVLWNRVQAVAVEDTGAEVEDTVAVDMVGAEVTVEETGVMIAVVAEATIPADAIGNFEDN